ncbi:hypothetical protein D3C86_1512670 [compost metagenome]
MLGGRPDHGLGLGAVGGHEHRQVGDDAGDREVLEDLVGRAVLAEGEARVGGGDLDVEVHVARGVADHLPGLADREHGKGAREGDLAGEREAAGGVDQVLLGDPHVEEALGELVGEVLGHGRAREVRVEHDDVGALAAELAKGLAVGGAGRDLVLGVDDGCSH